MSLITALTPLLNAKTAKVVLEVSAHPSKDDHLVVVAKPVVGPVPNNASEELKLIIAGLATGIKVVATAEAVEAELVAAITEQAPQRSEWAQRAAQITAAADAAAKKGATSKKDANTKASEKAPEQAVETAQKDAPQPSSEEAAKGQDETPDGKIADFDLEL